MPSKLTSAIAAYAPLIAASSVGAVHVTARTRPPDVTT
jgi:hypothetical protein